MQQAQQRYLVTIHYREPTYERHTYDNVTRLHPFKIRYEVTTLYPNEERARGLALREFYHVAAHSSVGWVRQIVQMECEALGDDVVCVVMGGARCR